MDRDDDLSKPGATKCCTAALSERGYQRFASGMQRRGEAAEDARGHTHEESEKQQAQIDGRSQSVSYGIAGQEGDKSPHGERGECDPEQSPGKCKEEAIGEKLSADPPGRST